MRLYIANKNYSSWSLRPWLLLRELQVGFDEVMVRFDGASNYERFRAFSPTGKVPCLVDGEITVWDSLAIVEYVAERDQRVWPRESAARAWARCAAAEMHAGFGALRNDCPMNVGLRIRLATLGAALQRDVARVDEMWQQGLQGFGGPFLAGARFTAVDAFFAPVAFRVQTYGLPLSAASASYVGRLLELGSMQQWQREALAETFRDPDHPDMVAGGTLIEDLRAPPR